MAKNTLRYVPQYDDQIEYIVVTQRYGPLNQWCDENGIENYSLPYRYCVYIPSKNKILTFVKRIAKLIIVSFSNLYALERIKRLKLADSIDLIHTNIGRDLLGIMISKKYGIPSITHLREISRSHFGLRLLYNKQLLYMNQFTNRFVAVSRAVKEDWAEYGLEQDKIRVVYDGVDPKSVHYEEHGEDREHRLRIVMSGTIYEGKGQFELVKAISALAQNQGVDITVDFYGRVSGGGGDYYRALTSYIRQKGLENIFNFKGYCGNNELRNILNKYDVGVICSKAEGFGLSTVEYMMAGLCVIASNTGANLELIHDKETGFLYPLGNTSELASIVSYIYYNRECAREIAQNAHAYAVNQYTVEKSMKCLIETYYKAYRGKCNGNSTQQQKSV